MADFSQWWWQAAAVDPGPGPGPGPDPGDPIGQSLRFRGAQNLKSPALLSTSTYTVSFWAKLSRPVAVEYLFAIGNGGIAIYNDDKIYFFNGH